jgi:glucans biosynthesis protein
MLASPRCGAKTRCDGACRAPAVHGKTRCRMHGGAEGSGALRRNCNARKHVGYSQDKRSPSEGTFACCWTKRAKC